MAGNGNDTLVKRNSKLEAFLQKHMDEDAFGRVRGHEPCIVCSKREDKAFKFVILSDEWIYLTENPPKRISEEVHMGNILSINFVNDFPSFLSGAERENTQHIVVKYMRREPPKGKGKKQLKAFERNSPRTSTYRGSLTARSGKGSPWAERKAQSLKEHGNKIETEGSRRNSIDAEVFRDVLTDRESPKSRKGSSKKKGKKGIKESLEEEEHGGATNGLGASRRTPNLTEDGVEQNGMGETTKSSPLKLNYTYTGELRLALEKLEEGNEDTGLLTTSRINNNNELSKSDSRLSFLRKMSQQQKEIEYDTDMEEWLPSELHLYLLSAVSPLLMLARSAWDNYLIRETLGQDEEYLLRTKTFVDTKKLGSEKFSLLYTQLKTELLLEENTLEEKFTLINELKVGAERNFCLKKLFWRTPDMLTYLIGELQMYMPSSPSRLIPDNEDDKCQRADELELSVLILETLSLMIRETEILPYRRSCLKVGQGKPLHDLVFLLVCQPELPIFETTLKCTKINPFNTGQLPTMESIADEELEDLCQEFNTAATALLFELLLITKQSNIGPENEGLLTINWLIGVIEEQEEKNSYVERVIASTMQLLSPVNTEELLPTEAVKLFQYFSLLQMLIGYSPSVGEFICENFYEEFKYYIQAPVILDKLPKHYPVSEATFKVIEDVLSLILGKPVSLALNNILS